MNRQYMHNKMGRQFINSAKVNDDVGRIELWGDVYEDTPIDWWTGEEVKGNFITYQKFKDAMDSVKECSTVEIHLNSYGGDATVGLTIANLIKSSKQHIIGINDGICASAGMTILSACHEVKTHKSSLFMIHQTMGLCIGYYNNEDLTKLMDCNSSYDSAAAEVYAAKTGLSKNQCLNLMKKTTWMTGVEAIEKGFADALVSEEEELSAPVELVNKSTMRINGLEHCIEMFNLSDDFVVRAQNNAIKNLGGKQRMGKKEDLKDKFFNTMSSFFAANSAKENDGDENDSAGDIVSNEKIANDEPSSDNAGITEEEVKNRINAAVKAERERIQSIQNLANKVDSDLVNEAMFGETACSASELALRALNKMKEKNEAALTSLLSDSEISKSNEVTSEPGAINDISDEEDEQEKAKKIAKAFKEKMDKLQGVK